jgi:hypothetical protein
MTGQWIKRMAMAHTCERPMRERPTERILVGDRWKCECGKVWEVGHIFRGDQREPLLPGEYPQIGWKEL